MIARGHFGQGAGERNCAESETEGIQIDCIEDVQIDYAEGVQIVYAKGVHKNVATTIGVPRLFGLSALP